MTESSAATALAAGSDGNDNMNAPTKIGFIGCGTIAVAIATGIATQSKIQIESITVSKRSEQKSKLLAETFPDLVAIQEDNQKILDGADLIFLCVLPQLTAEILKNLKFDNERHTLVSLVSTAKLEDVVQDSKLDATKVSKMICLPSIARHQGVSLHCCPTKNRFLTSLFQATGGVSTLQSEPELEAAMMTTCVMGPIYGMMKHGRDWLTQHTNLSAAEASELVVKQYVGAVLDAEKDCDQPTRLEDLIEEQTPGGINEQALRNMEQMGGMETQTKVMDAILSRIRGESDGSVSS
ncbi:MAG: hypothetical protein SGBAC_006064 [Bacillariaceae sp.]